MLAINVNTTNTFNKTKKIQIKLFAIIIIKKTIIYKIILNLKRIATFQNTNYNLDNF